MLSFSVDCKLFCKAWNPPEVFLLVVYFLLVSLTCLLGPQYLFGDQLGFDAFALPWVYRWQLYVINISGAVAYSILLPLTRMLLNRHQRKITAVEI